MDLNPYAPPPARPEDAPTRPSDHGWHVEGRSLFVEAGAVLPMVDLSSGMNEERMAMLRNELSLPSPSARIFITLGLLGILLPSFLGSGFVERFPFLGPAGFLCIVAGFLVIAFKREAVGFSSFITLKVNQRRRRRGIFMTGIQILLVVCCVITVSLGLPLAMLAASALVVAVLVIGTIAFSISENRLRCRRRQGTTFEVRGLHPNALLLLTQIQDRKKVAKS